MSLNTTLISIPFSHVTRSSSIPIMILGYELLSLVLIGYTKGDNHTRGGERMNNRVIIVIIVVLLIIGGGLFLVRYNSQNMQKQQGYPSQGASGSPTEEKYTVSIQNFSFSPDTLTVKVGEKVTWTNKDSTGHSATADDGSFDTGIIAQGQSGSATFSKAGTYTYHCSVHPNMKGTIVVQ